MTDKPMNAAQRLIDSYGPINLLVLGGTPPRKRWGKDRRLKPVEISKERAIAYMHAHARRRARAASK